MAQNTKSDKLLKEAKDRLSYCINEENTARTEALEDLRFVHGDQWDENVFRDRIAEQRPTLTINRTMAFCNSVIGDQRMSKPTVKTIAVDSSADPETAKIFDGLIMAIGYDSNSDDAIDTGFASCVHCGYGAWRFKTFYEEMSFNQKVAWERIQNPFSVYCDPSAKELDKSDADYWFITEFYTESVFEEKWPKAQKNFNVDSGTGDRTSMWTESGSDNGQKKIRVAEYWYKVHKTRKIYLLKNGDVIDQNEYETFEGEWDIVNEREEEYTEIEMCIFSGAEILEKPAKWVSGKYFPIVMVLGPEMAVDGDVRYRSLFHHMKDSARQLNYQASAATEAIGRSPKAPFLATAAQVAGHKQMWKNMNNQNTPYLLYTHVAGVPAPARVDFVPVPAGIIEARNAAIDDMKAITGIYDASLGRRSQEVSGRAIRERRHGSDIATYQFVGNLARAIKLSGKILIDIIPKIYDTERLLRLRGEDGKEKEVTVNEVVYDVEENIERVLNDLTIGKYDIRINVGPSYQTQRQEAADSMLDFIRAVPNAGQITGDLVAEAQDWPNADEFAERLRKALPPELIKNDDDEPPQPDPIQQQAMQMEQMKLEAQQAESQAKVATAQANAEKAKLAVQKEALEIQQMQITGTQEVVQNAQQSPSLEEIMQAIQREIIPVVRQESARSVKQILTGRKA